MSAALHASESMNGAGLRATLALTDQLLAWIAQAPRTYGEVMDVWPTSCPLLAIWEDAACDGLVRIVPSADHLASAPVELTEAGRERLSGARST